MTDADWGELERQAIMCLIERRLERLSNIEQRIAHLSRLEQRARFCLVVMAGIVVLAKALSAKGLL